MEAYNIEIGELIATMNGSLGYVISCDQGVFHVEWAVDDNTIKDWYYSDMIYQFRSNYKHYYGQSGR